MVDASDSLLEIYRCFKQGECEREEYEGMLQVLLFENVMQNRHSILHEIDEILQTCLLQYHDNDIDKDIFDITIGVIKWLQHSESSEIRNFFSKGYKGLLVLCRRYQSGEFDVFGFRERLQAIVFVEPPISEADKAVEAAYNETQYQLDDIEYHFVDSFEPNQLGKALAAEIINLSLRRNRKTAELTYHDVLSAVHQWAISSKIIWLQSGISVNISSGDVLLIHLDFPNCVASIVVKKPAFAPYRYVSFESLSLQGKYTSAQSNSNFLYCWHDNVGANIKTILLELDKGIEYCLSQPKNM